MAPVAVTIQVQDDEFVELVENLDTLVESTKCSCNAGDDNPF